MTIKKRLEVIEQKILIKDFEQQTSKKAIWKNKETKAYILWKEERGEIKKESPSDVEEQTERIIAKSVKNSLLIATPNETEEMLIYQDGIFIGGKIALSKIKQVIKEKANKAYSTDRRGKIKPYYLSIAIQKMIIDFIKSFSCCPLDDFDANERIINLKNGLYYLDGFQGVIPNPRTEDGHYDTKEDNHLIIGIKYFRTHEDFIKEYGEPYKSMIQIPVNYNMDAENLEIDEILSDIFSFETVPLFYEMVGYFILPTVKYGKAFMLYGQTGTGKTTVINIITQFIGFNNTSGVELQYLDVKFEIEKTKDKLINIFDDLSSRPIKYVGNFKKLVTNTWLYGRIKHLQNEVRWINRCKCLFACNDLPSIKEYVTDAFYKRWVLTPCFNSIKELGIKVKGIRDKKFSDMEMSGLFNKVIVGIKRLEERSNFPEIWQDIDFVKKYWNMDINPVALFVGEFCEVGEVKYEIDYDFLFKQINQFRKDHQVKEISKTMITKSLKKLNDKIDVKKVSAKSPSINRFTSGHKYIGIKLKGDFEIKNIEIDNLGMDRFLEKEEDLIDIIKDKVN